MNEPGPAAPPPRRPLGGTRRVIAAIVAACSFAAPAPCAEPTNTADRLLAGYEAVRSVSCEVRKDTRNPGLRVRALSRVHYLRPDRLHVENVTPIKRRIVCDGTNFHSYAEGDPKGFRRPVADLDEDMKQQLRKAPGTAMDHLFKLRGLPEQVLESTEEFPVRRGYAAGKVFAVLSLDALGRLARFEFFANADRAVKTAQYDFDRFFKVTDDAWIPRRHRCRATLGGVETEETVHIDRLEVNAPMPPGLFDAGSFFQGVGFASDFADIYGR